MKFCPVVPEICRGQVHGARKERRRIRIIIIRNGAKTISPPNFVWETEILPCKAFILTVKLEYNAQ
jgi:hypothetical protein